MTCWPHDGGPFITLPIVITKDPETGVQNAGMYRMQKFDNASTGMHWQYNKDGARHYRKYCEMGKRMEIAVALGGCPAVTYAATAPLPPDVDEMMFAGFLEGRAIEVVQAKTVDLMVPAESDFVIEGYVEPGDERTEGPFGDHTGFYSAADTYPVFHVTCIMGRHDAVYPSTIVGKPPMEDCYMAKASERIFLPFIKMLVNEIVDINLPIEGVFHNCALVSIDKQYPGQAKKVIHALWGLGQMASTKCIAVFDKDIDLSDYSTVVWKLLNNVDPKRDILLSEGPLDALDHSAPHANFGSKMGIDATRKSKEEGMSRDWPEEIAMNDAIKNLVTRRWKEYGFDT
jgi:4-hydroxy-3-polyprenylbenzoate decarboxylase